MQFVKGFSEINVNDVFAMGKNNYFLGDAYQYLKAKNVSIPDGFVIMKEGFNYFLIENHLRDKLSKELSKLDKTDFSNLKEISFLARSIKVVMPFRLFLAGSATMYSTVISFSNRSKRSLRNLKSRYLARPGRNKSI